MIACQNGGGSSDPFFTLSMRVSVTSRSRHWYAGKPQPSSVLATQWKRGGWWSTLALSECVGAKRLSLPEGVPWNSRLLRGAAWRNGCTDHGPPEVHHLFQNIPRDPLQSGTRTLQLPCPLLEHGDLSNLNMIDVLMKDLWLWHLNKAPHHQKGWSVYPPLVRWLHQSQRRLLSPRSWPWYLAKDHWHPLGLPFHRQMSLTHPLQSRQTGPQVYPLDPNRILPPWSPCKWPYHSTQWQVKYNATNSPGLLPWHPWPRHPRHWSWPNLQINPTPQIE